MPLAVGAPIRQEHNTPKIPHLGGLLKSRLFAHESQYNEDTCTISLSICGEIYRGGEIYLWHSTRIEHGASLCRLHAPLWSSHTPTRSNPTVQPGCILQLFLESSGMLTVSDLSVEWGLGGVEVVCPENELGMAESMLCNAVYRLTQASPRACISISRPKEALRMNATRSAWNAARRVVLLI